MTLGEVVGLAKGVALLERINAPHWINADKEKPEITYYELNRDDAAETTYKDNFSDVVLVQDSNGTIGFGNYGTTDGIEGGFWETFISGVRSGCHGEYTVNCQNIVAWMPLPEKWESEDIGEIKECPFCGGAAGIRTRQPDFIDKWFTVYCTECGVRGPEFSKEKHAINAWNKRFEEKTNEEIRSDSM